MAKARVNVIFGADLKEFSTKMQNAQRKIGKIGKSMQNVGTKLSVGVTVPLVGLAAGAIKAASQLETLETSLSVMTGSAESGKAALKELSDFTARTPFQLEQVGSAAKQLLAFGFSMEQVKTNLVSLGDVAAGSGNQIGAVAQIFGQVSAAGKLTGERFNQLQERAIPIGSAIAKTMGIAESSVKEFITKGKVSFTDFEKAFKSLANEGGLFAGAMDKQSKTIAGLFSTLKDNVQLSLGQLGVSISESINLKEIVAGLITTIQGLTEKFNALSPATKKFVVIAGGIAAAIGPLLALAGTILPALISGFTILAGPVGLVVAAVTAIGVIIYKNWTPIKQTLVDVANYFIDLYNESSAFRGAIDMIIANFKNWWDIAKFVFGAMVSVIKGVVSSFVDGFKIIGKVIKGALTLDSDLIAEAWNDFKKAGLDTTAQLITDLGKDWEQLKQDLADNVQQGIENGGKKAKIVLKPDQVVVPAPSGGGGSGGSSARPYKSSDAQFFQPIASSFFGSANEKDAPDLQGIAPDFLATSSIVDEFIEKQEQLESTSKRVGEAVANSFTKMATSFLSSLGLADTAFGEFVISIGQAVIKLIATLLAQTIATAISGAFTSAAATGPAFVGTAPAFMATSVGTASAAFAAIPAFADGGIVSGETLALVGEYSGASSNPEVIAPLDKLKNMINPSGSQNVTVDGEFVIEGRKLKLVLDRENTNNSRIR